MRNGFVLAAILLLGANIQAKLETLPFPEVKCRDEVLAKLQEWKVTGAWVAQPIVTANEPTYIAKTSKVGSWAQIQLLPEGTVAAALVTAHTQLGIEWIEMANVSAPEVRSLAAASCQPKVSRAARDIFPKVRNEFSDASLLEQMEKNKSGVIFLWSPHMTYSIRALEAARKAAKEAKLPITILLDSEADLVAAEQVRAKFGWSAEVLRLNHSLELYLLGMQNHFPSLRVYKNKQMTAHLTPGLMTADGYAKVIRAELK